MSARVSARWLVSRRYDLTFFIGGAVLTLVFLGLYELLERLGMPIHGESVLITYFVYTALFDHPHIFQTFSRTHLDRTELSRHRATHTYGLAAFIAIGFGVAAMRLERELIVVAAIYGSWHIVRQHWGFLRIYKALNDDFSPIDDWIDGVLFYAGMAALILYDYTGPGETTVVYGELTARFPVIPDWISQTTWWLFVSSGVAFVGRQAWLLKQGKPINGPKLLLLLAALGTHSVVFFFTATPFLVAEALETAYHNVQYQGFMMHYQRRRFAAGTVKRWLKMAFVYGLLVGVIEIVGLVYRSWSWVFIPFAMLVLWHYYVDGKIWKIGSSPELRTLIRERDPGAAPAE